MAFGGRGNPFENVEPLFPRRRPPDLSGFRPSRGTRRGLYIAAAVLLVVILLSPLVGFYTDLLWFRSLNYQGLFLTRFQYQGWVFLAVFVVAFVALSASTSYAVRQVGFNALSAIGVSRRFLTAAVGRLVLVGSAVVALVMAAIATGSWETVARAFNAVSFNRSDPLFGQDISFYVFQLPLYRFVWGWALALLIICAALAMPVYFSRGSASVLPPRGVSHASILAAGFFVLMAVHYRLSMFELLLSKNGFVFGAGYTDVNARLPMLWVMLSISVILAVAMLANVALGRRGLLVVPLALWLVAAFVLLVIVPAVVQAVVVTPAARSQEKPYIQREIDATNTAFGLDQLTYKDFTDKQTVTQELLARNGGTVNNLRLWDYAPLQQAYQQIQSIRQFYDFNDVDIDRYTLADGFHQVMLSARELSPDRLPQSAQTWVNIHLKYTHGYGAAATPVSKVAQEGLPFLSLQDIPPTGEPKIDRPQIYFGETTNQYVVVDTNEPEVDYEKQDSQVYSTWQGQNGVQLSGPLRRLAFAYQLGDFNLLISSQVTAQSQVLYRRKIQDRLAALTPFLTYDHDPYLVISGGRMYWIVDAYTTSDSYPYSQRTAADTYGIQADTNYVRNSVKAVVDAYDGSVSFYIADSSDPVIATYSRIFPGVFQPLSAMPAGLRQHIRYPEDMFTLQAQTLLTFHMHDPQVFYGGTDAWALPNEVTQQGGGTGPLQPYYVVMRLPGMDHEEFVLIQPFTPLNKKNMVAWMAARSDGADYGKLQVFQFPSSRLVTGPEQVESRVDQEPSIKQELALLNQQGSQVIRGNLLVIPVEDSLLFVEPVYLASTSGSPIPELKKVVVANEQKVVWADTLDQALQALTSGEAPTTTPGGTVTAPVSGSLQQLAAQAQSLWADAQAKLHAGDLGGYQKDIDQLGSLLDQIKTQSGAPTPGPSPSPKASASP